MRDNKDFSYKIGGLICLIIAVSLFTCEKIPDHCGGKGPETWYNPDYQFCFAGKARDLCGGKKYNPLTDVCENHILGTRCADESFVPTGAPCAGYTLTTATVPAVGGIITRTEEGPNYPAGYDVILIAEAAAGYTFAGWAGAQTSASTMLSVRMDTNKPIVAMFNKLGESGAGMYTLFASAFPENGGTVTYQNGPDYAAGTQITVTAEAKPGYTFTGWSGASTSTSRSVPITMNTGKTLVAMFTPMVYTLTVNSVPEDGGAVFINGTALTGAAPQNAGTTVTALARPAEGYVFAGWSGAASGTDNPKTINISGSNATLTARFTRSDNADQCAIAPQITPGCHGYNPCTGLTAALPGSQCCIANSSFPGCGGDDNPPSCTDWTVNVEATCELAGEKTRYCNGVLETETIERLPSTDPSCQHTHTAGEWAVLQEATCTAPGTQVQRCTACYEIVNIQEIAQLPPTDPSCGNVIFHMLVVNTSGTGSGTVTKSVGGTTTIATSFNDGTVVTLTAQSNSNSTFSGWSGAGCSGTGNCAVTMTQAWTVTANFTLNTVTPPTDSTVTDPRDNQTYPTVKIGDRIWMVKNINYTTSTSNSWCYNNAADSCTKYGRLYTWDAAMSACDGLGSEWRLPDTADWNKLVSAAGDNVAGTKLKAKSPDWDGEDAYGFSALPGGNRTTYGIVYVAGSAGSWWSATENGSTSAWFRNMGTGYAIVGGGTFAKDDGLSVRCAKDCASCD
ncbi:MAG: InlB B-repeat-containing protein [Chitinispirillia bacterium]|nr:InlB B-repeat-containing protein [Chitinispirillia bacterium]